MVKIQDLVDEEKCFETVRQMRWTSGVNCPHCDSPDVTRRGFHNTQKHRQRYECRGCQKQFDDLTGTVFEGHHQPLRVWILCLYLMGLNLSNYQIAAELDLNKNDVQAMTACLREGILVKKSP